MRELLESWWIYLTTESMGGGGILSGFKVTIQVLAVASITTIIFGLMVAVLRVSPIKPLRLLAQAYIEFFRGTPLLVQILFIFTALPMITGWYLTPFQTAILALTLNSGSYMAESYRSGLEAIPIGQREAAMALGMSNLLAFRRVIFPQAIKVILPAIGNTITGLLLATSFVFLVGIQDMVATANQVLLATGDFSVFLLITIIYVLFGLFLVWGTKKMERRLQRS